MQSTFRNQPVSVFYEFLLGSAGVLLAFSALHAFAGGPQVVYSTLGEPGDTFYKPAGDVLNFNSEAVPFTNTVDGTLASVKLGLSQQSGTGNQFEISLVTDSVNGSGDHVPSNNTLEMWTQVGAAAIGSSGLTVSSFTSAAQPTLTAGTVYWVVAEVATPTNYTKLGTWNFNDQGITGSMAQSTIDGTGTAQPWTVLAPSTTLPALQVLVTQVPEPETVYFLLGGLATIVVLRRLGRR